MCTVHTYVTCSSYSLQHHHIPSQLHAGKAPHAVPLPGPMLPWPLIHRRVLQTVLPQEEHQLLVGSNPADLQAHHKNMQLIWNPANKTSKRILQTHPSRTPGNTQRDSCPHHSLKSQAHLHSLERSIPKNLHQTLHGPITPWHRLRGG